MAEPWAIAFGRYLRTLRERRGLSLQDVASLSQSFSETLNKGYLSRCENGKQRLGFSKAYPLSRIYKVPGDVLLERQELDLELEHVGGPVTEGLSFAELTAAGANQLRAGERWSAYGSFRDALVHAHTDAIKPSFRDRSEQVGSAYQNAATGARALGRYRFALHEYLYVKGANLIGPRFYPILLERLSTVHANLGDLPESRRYGDEACDAAARCDNPAYKGYVFFTRALVAYHEKEMELAIDFYNKAYEAYRIAGVEDGRALVLNNLAQLYLDLDRLGAARRAVSAGEQLARSNGFFRVLALCLMLRGEIDVRENRPLRAEKGWREAGSIGKKLNDSVLRFKADYLLLTKAMREGNDSVARAIRRRLKKLANYVPTDTDELLDFEELDRRMSVAS